MRIFHGLVLASLVTTISACSSPGQSPTQMASNFIKQQNIISTSSGEYPSKDPQAVALYQDSNSPHAPYRIIAVASISRHNLLGIKRSDATMQTMMKQLAANMGGDGLINMSRDSDTLKAHVIAYQKILI